MSEVRFQTESALIDAQKKRQTDDRQVGNNKPSGIDFKNDTVLVTARVNFQNAQAIENSRLLDKTSAAADLSHTESDISSLLATYQNQLNQLSQAQAQSESLSDHTKSVLEQLTVQNATVAKLDSDKTASAGVISNLSTQIASKGAEKSRAEGRKSSAQKTISTNTAKIKELRDSITEETTEESKASIEKQIAQLEQEIATAEKDIEKANNEIERIDAEITDLAAQKTAEEANFSRLETELAEAVMVQTGLSLQQASLTALLKEAQTYESSLNAMIMTTEHQIETKEAEKEAKQKKLDEATEKADQATADVEEKEAAYNAEETQAKLRAEEKESQQNIFMA